MQNLIDQTTLQLNQNIQSAKILESDLDGSILPQDQQDQVRQNLAESLRLKAEGLSYMSIQQLKKYCADFSKENAQGILNLLKNLRATFQNIESLIGEKNLDQKFTEGIDLSAQTKRI